MKKDKKEEKKKGTSEGVIHNSEASADGEISYRSVNKK